MEYDLIQLAKECPGLTVSIKLTDLVEANKELIKETKRNLQQTLEDAKSEEYLSREKVIEWLEVSATTLWRWEKCGYLIPVAVGNKKKYRMSDIQKILQQ